MNIVYEVIFTKRKENGVLPYRYIGSKSNCTFIDGVIFDKRKKPYYGSSSVKGYNDIVKENIDDITTTILFTFDDYKDALEKEKEIHILSDVVVSTEFFNKSIATISTYSDPAYATVKHHITGKVVRLLKDDVNIINGTYVGLTKGRSVKDDPNHINRGSKGEKNGFYGKSHSEKTLRKISESNSGRKASEETLNKLSNFQKGKPKSPEHRKKIGRAGLVMIRCVETGERKRVSKEDFEVIYKPLGWVYNLSGFKPKVFPCDHCGLETTKGMLSRWHNDNCKHRIINEN